MSNRDFAIGEQNFKEKPDISQVFIRAIDRNNHVAVQYGISEPGIKQILSMLPMASREWVYDREDEYRKSLPTLVYKKYTTVRLGDPIPLRDDEAIPFKYDEEGNIDLDDVNIISPKIKSISTLDKQAFNEIVMEAAEFAGLTWQSELLLLDGGDTVEEIQRKKTLYRMPDHIREKTQYRKTPIEEPEE